MQGVVNDMMAGLSATPRFHPPLSLGGMVTAQQQVGDEVTCSGSSRVSLRLEFSLRAGGGVGLGFFLVRAFPLW